VNNNNNHYQLCHINTAAEQTTNEEKLGKCKQGEEPITSLSNYKYIFILGQLLHGMGASALITLGTTLLDESVKEKMAPVFIGIFESSFVLGPALG
jgi:organic anion transporter 4A